jgi:hypothetical protein
MKKQVEYLQRLFYDIWNDFGSVYLLIKHSGNTVIGKRGFTEEEMKHGLILVFNNKTSNSLNWDADGNLTCILAFGARKEDLFIHYDDLVGVFSSEAGVQYLRNDVNNKTAPASSVQEPGDDGHVVSISSFKKRKAKP